MDGWMWGWGWIKRVDDELEPRGGGRMRGDDK